MSYRFTNCLNIHGLRTVPIDRLNIKKELQESRKDLESARKSLHEQDYKWTIIKAYYSMFHAGKSLILSAGYMEKSHDCLIIAVEELFANKGLLPPSTVTDFRNAKTARESADYGLTYGKDSAEGTVRDAESMHQLVSTYLSKQGFRIPSP
ncbi:MAG TPA: HEPN domain-containing protein [Methanoregulaceae archaeon]|nr:MAG: HEPN domain-containing protein [Methanolinea sp.]HON81806.1 HEPN domain-containing protein [Methanoregulaceae archaeon]HPD11104.1 HEPN domain-containing protein [Methanoregulaceae archaeon]HRT15632.1 HEPN domain-containing protein [Methanoregulaceae archaeon]HRU31692.1 HEPN domain-containing protein [Methanoregulaceae archaeon]